LLVLPTFRRILNFFTGTFDIFPYTLHRVTCGRAKCDNQYSHYRYEFFHHFFFLSGSQKVEEANLEHRFFFVCNI